MNAIGDQSQGTRHTRAAILLVALLGSAALSQVGCAYATLGSVIVNDQLAENPLPLKIFREGKEVLAKCGMALKVDDEIETSGESSAFIKFEGANDAEILLLPATRVQLGSFWEKFGKVIANIRKVKDEFAAKFVYGSAAATGTEFLSEVDDEGNVKVTVLEGKVVLSPTEGGWEPVEIGPLQQATMEGAAPPEAREAPPDELQELIQHINRLHRDRGGEVSLVVPNVVGLSLENARALLQQEGLATGQIRRQIAADDQIGIVSDQSPVVGSRQPALRGVELVTGVQAVTVPPLRGKSIEEARQLLTQKGLEARIVRETNITTEVKPLTVRSQNPPASDVVPDGAPVELHIEPDYVIVPEVVGRHIDEAKDDLLATRLQPDDIRKKLMEGVEGTVLSQSPKPGTPVAADTAVDLEVVEEGVRVPSVLGLPLIEAERELALRNLQTESHERITPAKDVQPKGTVLTQQPEPGKLVSRNTLVQLNVEGPSVLVPPFVDRGMDWARNALSQIGLQLGNSRSELTDQKPPNTVMSQNPAADSRVPLRSSVNLVYAEEGVRVPNLIGADTREAFRRLSAVKLQGQRAEEPRVDTPPGVRQSGQVFKQSPPAGQLVSPGGSVGFTVWIHLVDPDARMGRPVPAQNPVPNVIGLTEPDARSILQRAGFRVEVRVQHTESEFNSDKIFDQQPRAGTAPPGSTVYIHILKY